MQRDRRSVTRTLITHPAIQPLLALLFLGLCMVSLTSIWRRRTSAMPAMPYLPAGSNLVEVDMTVDEGQGGGALNGERGLRQVVAHFMLGNTYRWEEKDWSETFQLVSETNLDGLALNLGPEPWQLEQARTAYNLSSSRGGFPKLFLSLDLNVLPSSTWEDATKLIEHISELLTSTAQLKWGGQDEIVDKERPVLSTFSGHQAEWGGKGWEGFLHALNVEIGQKVMFWPSFFMPPEDFMNLPYVDGTFAWNAAWPMDDHAITMNEDEPFLQNNKPYMAAVSPLFYTHYGNKGEWAFNKNWIYRSDDLLFPTRWSQLLSLPSSSSPEIIQIISWNDHGESHSISPVHLVRPGSDSWTKNMPHEAFRQMSSYFASRWRDGMQKVGQDDRGVAVWMWYRVQPKGIVIENDQVGRPEHADWARDLINIVCLVPFNVKYRLILHNQDSRFESALESGRMNAFTYPFIPGAVKFFIMSDDGLVLEGRGRDIDESGEFYNFNMWSGVWRS